MESSATSHGSDVIFVDTPTGLAVSVETPPSAYLTYLQNMPEGDHQDTSLEKIDQSVDREISFSLHAAQVPKKNSENLSNRKNAKNVTCRSLYASSVKHVCECGSGSDFGTSLQQFRCGVCQKKFQTICCLHDHLKSYHRTSGSYHYDDILQTAFPKYESFCRFTQTDDDSFDCALSRDDHVLDVCSSFIETKDSGNILSETENEYEAADDLDGSCDKSENASIPGDKNQDISDRFREKEFASSVKKRHKREKSHNKKKLKAQKHKETSLKTLQNKEKRKNINKTKSSENNEDDFIANKSKNVASVSTSYSLEKTELNSPNAVYCCEICNTSFKNNSNLVRHETSKHPDELKEICEDCGKKFMRERDLNRHRSYAHSLVKPKKEALNSSDLSVCSEDCDSFPKDDDSEQLISDLVDIKVKTEKPIGKAKVSRNQKKPRSKEEIMLLKLPYTCEQCGHIMPRSKMEIHKRIHTGNVYKFKRTF